MKQLKGEPRNIQEPILGLVTHKPQSLSRKKSLFVAERSSFWSLGFAGVIAIDHGREQHQPVVRVSREDFSDLKEGDCVLVGADGTITVVWDTKAPMNPLLLTEMCNCRCLMCPQPPKPDDRTLIERAKHILQLVKLRKSQTVCLTGGEPTLLKDDFFDVLNLIKKNNSKASVMMLTNGKSFQDFEFTRRFIAERPKSFLTCVSIHGDVDEVHDRIVGVKDSFYKTCMGLHNLARFREKIELRVVVSSINADRLESIAVFIQRNFPFISHCTFMGMEIAGLARENYDTIWIDPLDYRDELFRAVKVLSRAGMLVSIYNLPLCLVEPKVRNFAKRSISEWKNDYLPVCEKCSVKQECCGVFTTSGSHLSPHIRPLSVHPEANTTAGRSTTKANTIIANIDIRE